MQNSTPHCQNPIDFVRTVSALETAELVAEHFKDIVACYGGFHVLIFRLPQEHEALADCILMDTRPVEWARRHRRQSYTIVDPLVQIAQRRATPCSWSEAMAEFSHDAKEHAIHAERLSHGVTDGLLVPIHTKNGYAGLVAISAKSAFAEPAIHSLAVMSLVVHNQLSALLRSDPGDQVDFTAQEIECLKWAAAGKSDSEIATILELSPKTVNFHIEGAKRRMNAASRTHAVASAIRSGLIH